MCVCVRLRRRKKFFFIEGGEEKIPQVHERAKKYRSQCELKYHAHLIDE